MSDPERLLHGSAGALSARLLRAGHDEAPPRRSLERTLAAVGVATTTLGTAGTAGALGSTAGAGAASTAGTVGAVGAAGKAATTLTLLGIAKWAGVGVASGVAVSLAAHGIETRVAAPRSAVTARAHVAVTPGTAPPVASATPEAPQVAAVPPAGDGTDSAEASPVATDAKVPKTSPNSAPLAAPPANLDDRANAPLAAEVTFVDRGRALFQRSDARGALAALAGYEREFPEHRLLPEVLLLRMEASNAAGDTAHAQAFARVIVREYGRSPHAARARALLGEHAGGQP